MTAAAGAAGPAPPTRRGRHREDGAPPKAASRRRRVIIRLVQVAIVAATAYFLVAYLVRSWGSIEDFDWTLDPGWLVASGVAFLVYYFAQAGFWWLLLRGCGARSPSGRRRRCGASRSSRATCPATSSCSWGAPG